MLGCKEMLLSWRKSSKWLVGEISKLLSLFTTKFILFFHLGVEVGENNEMKSGSLFVG